MCFLTTCELLDYQSKSGVQSQNYAEIGLCPLENINKTLLSSLYTVLCMY
uniref:Uncharacterized protein n=1 Tax=Anguilla anguilla TaxID=7936 RepID=A0A0E9RA65_ANGAN